MRRFLTLLLVLTLLAGSALGCGSDKDKGVNKNNADRPKADPEGK